MARFNTNIEVIWASEEEMDRYYAAATQKMNALLKKYAIRNAEVEFEQVSVDKLRAPLVSKGFFEATALKSIFFDQKQAFVPQEIVHAFRSIISDPPISIKAIFLNTFITHLTDNGWDASLRRYFEKEYGFPPDGTIILEDLKDFSLGFGVYSATFQLRTPRREKIIVFLKRSSELRAYNEVFYFSLQKKGLSTASYAAMPCVLANKEHDRLLLSPVISGVSSDTVFSILVEAAKKHPHEGHLKKALEVLIEAFIHHAVLGDLLGRNDRHLMNSLIDAVVDGVPQKNTLDDLNSSEKILAYAENIAINQTKGISVIDIDLKWLLGEKNTGWALAEIDVGLSELNLLSLFPEFNDFDSNVNPFFEKRKAYIAHYFDVYCQTQAALLANKELLLSAVKKAYPASIAEKKLKILTERIAIFKKSKERVIEFFRRYLLDFRIRWVHKATLMELDNLAKESNDMHFLKVLKESHLLRYLPPQSDFASYESSVLLQLQCFRGVLSKKDKMRLSEKDREAWETVAANISMIAEKFNYPLFKTLEDKKKFIRQDTAALLKVL